jgi:hypothetical protein
MTAHLMRTTSDFDESSMYFAGPDDLEYDRACRGCDRPFVLGEMVFSYQPFEGSCYILVCLPCAVEASVLRPIEVTP